MQHVYGLRVKLIQIEIKHPFKPLLVLKVLQIFKKPYFYLCVDNCDHRQLCQENVLKEQ